MQQVTTFLPGCYENRHSDYLAECKNKTDYNKLINIASRHRVIHRGNENVFFAACQGGYNKAIEEMLRVDPKLACDLYKAADTQESISPLIIAAAAGHTEAVTMLIYSIQVNDPEMINWGLPGSGKTALYIASENNHAAVVEVLLTSKLIKSNLPGKENDISLTPLCIASKRGHMEVVKVFLNFKQNMIDVNIRGDDGSTSLILATDCGHANVVRELLKYDGLDINAKDKKGDSALSKAVANRDYDMVAVMLAKDATSGRRFWEEENIQHAFDTALKLKGGNQRKIKKKLEEYSKKHHKEKLKPDSNQQVKKVESIMRFTPTTTVYPKLRWNDYSHGEIDRRKNNLFVACRDGNDKAVNELLRVSPELAIQNCVYPSISRSTTPLIVAAKYGNTNIVKMLICYMAPRNPEMINYRMQNSGKTALYIAAENNHDEVVQVLLEFGKADSNLPGIGQTGIMLPPLCISTINRNVKTVRAFLELRQNGVNVNIRGEDNLTPLMHAVESGQADLVDMFLNIEDVDINAHDSQGYSALSKAVLNNHVDIVNAMLSMKITSKRKWEQVNVKDAYACALYLDQIARERIVNDLNDYSEMYYGKIEDVSDINHDYIRMRRTIVNLEINIARNHGVINPFRQHPFFAACQEGRYGAVEAMLKEEPILATQEYKSSRSNKMWTPLMAAAEAGHIKTVSIILSSIATRKTEIINACLTSGETALFMATRNNHCEVVKFLLSSSNEISLDQPAGKRNDRAVLSPVCIASKLGYIKLVHIFLGLKYNLSITKEIVSASLILAAESGHTGVVKMILRDRRVDINAKNNQGYSALSIALLNGDYDTACAILELSGNISKEDMSTLMLTRQSGHTHLLQTLFATYNVGKNVKGSERHFSLSLAVLSGDHETVSKMLRKGVNPGKVWELRSVQQAFLYAKGLESVSKVQIIKELSDYSEQYHRTTLKRSVPTHSRNTVKYSFSGGFSNVFASRVVAKIPPSTISRNSVGLQNDENLPGRSCLKVPKRNQVKSFRKRVSFNI